MAELLERCFEEVAVGRLLLRNRLLKAATFEGKTPGGHVSADLIAFHERLGRGGIAMTNLGYCAAENDGRINENMLYMHEGIADELKTLIAKVHETDAAVAGQLGHCGSFTKNRELSRSRPLGPSFGLNPLGVGFGLALIQGMSQQDIAAKVAVFGRAAAFMKEVGFDAIEIHFGHGYGISQFISPKTNHRKDKYGGSIANRMRFALECLEAVRAEVGDDFPLFGKISMTDGVAGGVSYEEGIEVARLLDQGGIDCLVCSGGTSSMNPMLLFRGDSILDGLVKRETSAWMRMAMRVVGKRMFRHYPYEELYFLDPARRIRAAVSCRVCYIGGAGTADSLRVLMAEGFDFVQLGRGLIYDPDMPLRLKEDRRYVNGCNHCNQCATLIEAPHGIRCVYHGEDGVGGRG